MLGFPNFVNDQLPLIYRSKSVHFSLAWWPIYYRRWIGQKGKDGDTVGELRWLPIHLWPSQSKSNQIWFLTFHSRALHSNCVLSFTKSEKARAMKRGFPVIVTLNLFINQLIRSSVQFSCSVMSDSLWPHESQHARPPCPSPAPGVHSDSRPSSQWCHPAISSSVVPFSSCPQSLPASESFPVSQLLARDGQSTGVSASASVLPKKSRGWSPHLICHTTPFSLLFVQPDYPKGEGWIAIEHGLD